MKSFNTAAAIAILIAVVCAWQLLAKNQAPVVTVGPANADIIGTDGVAIQKAIERVAKAGGGTIFIKSGTYTLNDSIRMTSHITLRGENRDAVILRRAPTLTGKLAIDADSTESQATLEDARAFSPGMGVTIRNQGMHGATVHTITRVEGNVVYFQHIIGHDYEVSNDARIYNTFSLVIAEDANDVGLEDLTIDGNDPQAPFLYGSEGGAVYFYHVNRPVIRNCIVRNFPGDGISVQYAEDPVIENCEAYENAQLGIHLGTGAMRSIVRYNRAHDNRGDGFYLCYRVQHSQYEHNESNRNGGFGISLGHKDTDNIFVKNLVKDNARGGIHFRKEPRASAANRNVFRENQIVNNGGAENHGGGVRVDGETEDVTFISNVIRDSRAPDAQRAGIRIGASARHVTCERNVIEGFGTQAIVGQSQSRSDRVQALAAH